jgi:hypothetical protein
MPQDEWQLGTPLGVTDTFLCSNCGAMCLLEPGKQEWATQFHVAPQPDVVIPVTPIVRCTVYRRAENSTATWDDDQWCRDRPDWVDEDGNYWYADGEEDEALWELAQDVVLSPPVWDVQQLMRPHQGRPQLIHLGEKCTLWDADGRARRGHWFGSASVTDPES